MHSAASQSISRPAASSSRPSAFDRMSGIRPQPASSSSGIASSSMPSLGRASSSLSTTHNENLRGVQLSEPKYLSSSIKNGLSSSSTSLPHPRTGSSSRPMPGAFQKSSDSDDSDIEIISATEFHYNSRSPSARLPAARQNEQSATNSALRMAAYGTKAVPSWMSGKWPAQDPNSASSSMNSHSPNSPFSNGTGVSTTSIYASNHLARHQAIGNDQYGPGSSIPAGYSRNPGYNMNNPGPGLGNGLHNLNGRLFGNMNQFGPPSIPGAGINNGFMRPPFPGGSFEDVMYGPQHGAFNERMNEQLDYIMNDPRKTNDEIKALIENIRPDEDLPAENREGTPEGLRYPLVCSHSLSSDCDKTRTDFYLV